LRGQTFEDKPQANICFAQIMNSVTELNDTSQKNNNNILVIFPLSPPCARSVLHTRRSLKVSLHVAQLYPHNVTLYNSKLPASVVHRGLWSAVDHTVCAAPRTLCGRSYNRTFRRP